MCREVVYHHALLDVAFPQQHITVKYEDIIHHPAKTFTRMAEFVDKKRQVYHSRMQTHSIVLNTL